MNAGKNRKMKTTGKKSSMRSDDALAEVMRRAQDEKIKEIYISTQAPHQRCESTEAWADPKVRVTRARI
jgi:hypothetical protein